MYEKSYKYLFYCPRHRTVLSRCQTALVEQGEMLQDDQELVLLADMRNCI